MSGGTPQVEQALKEALRLFEAEEFSDAFNLFQKVVSVEPDNLTALMKMGEILYAGGQIDEAITVFAQATETAPDEFQPRSNYVHLLYRQKRYQEMLPHLDTLIDKEPTNPHWYSMAAVIYQGLGEAEKVLGYLNDGQEKASRGLDWQLGVRNRLSDDDQKLLDKSNEKTADDIARNTLQAIPAAVTWTAVPDGDDGTMQLRGACRGIDENWQVSFEITADDDAEKPAVTVQAEFNKSFSGDDIKVWAGVADNLEPGKTYTCRLLADDGTATLDGGETGFATPAPLPAEAETGNASLIGTDGLTVQGAAGGTCLPTRTWFAWGTDAGNLSNATPSRPLPPGRTLRVRDFPFHNLKRWNVYAVETNMKPNAGKSGGENIPDYALKLTAPYGKDRNHLSGVGVADLVCSWDCTVQPLEEIEGRYPGDSLDFRDAEVEFTLESSGLDAKDFLISFWFHSFTGTTSTGVGTEDSAPWGLTGQLVDPAQISTDPKTFRFTLPCRSADWTYAGNNPAEQFGHSNRYTYYPLHDSLADHRGNMVLIFLFGDERVTLEGAIDIHAGSLKCRNPSLLAPGTAARLVSWPRESLMDPQSLTNGWVGNPDHFWISGPNPDEPQEFVWELGPETTVEALRLRQNPLFPSERAEVLGGDTRDDWEMLWETDLPAEPEGDKNELSVFRVLDSAAEIRFLKLRILSGYNKEFWGLDAIEVFGSGPDPRPELEPCTLCEDLAGLKPGSEIFYQLVAENEAGESRGEVRSFTLPEDQTPVILGAEVFSQEPGKTTVLVRLNAMGLETTLTGHCEDGDGNALEDVSRPAGSEKTPRHITYAARGVSPGTLYSLELTAENEAGTSPPLVLEWEPPKEKKA